MPPKKKTTALRAPTPSGSARPNGKAGSAVPSSPNGSHFRAQAHSPHKDVHVSVGVHRSPAKAEARGFVRQGDGDDEEAKDEELDMLIENYEVETSSRTQILRDRITTVFLPMLLRRFAREMGRLTPDVANVTAEEHMIRDGGSLRRTLEYVGQARFENVLRAGEKRAADEELDDVGAREVDRMGLGMTDIEKSARKRKRVHPPSHPQVNGDATHEEGDVVDGSFVVLPHAGQSAMGKNGRAKGKGKAVERNGSTSRNGRATRSRDSTAEPQPTFNWTASATSAGFLNPHLPQTPSLNRAGGSKKPRPARRNESLISINGSPVLAAVPDGMEVDALQLDGEKIPEDDEEQDSIPRNRGRGRASSASSGGAGKARATGKAKAVPKATPVRRSSRSRSRGSSVQPIQGRQGVPTGSFTFSEASRWKELEQQLMSTDMDRGAKAKLQEMLAQLRMTELGQ